MLGRSWSSSVSGLSSASFFTCRQRLTLTVPQCVCVRIRCKDIFILLVQSQYCEANGGDNGDSSDDKDGNDDGVDDNDDSDNRQ